MLPTDFHYANPKAIELLLIIIPFIFILKYFDTRNRKRLNIFFAPHSQKKMIPSYSKKRDHWKSITLILASIFITIALMGPRGAGHEINSIVKKNPTNNNQYKLRRKIHDVIFLLDSSASMSAIDTRTKESRLEYAKEIIDEIARNLRGQNVALYAFTSDVTTLVPLTPDVLYLRLLLENTTINEGDVAGTDLLNAFESISKKQFKNKKHNLKTIILLSDGGDTYLEQLSTEQRPEQINTIIDRLGNAKDNNFKLFTIGMGSSKGAIIPDLAFEGAPVYSTLDEEFLTNVSSRCRGKYFFANDFSAPQIAEAINIFILNDDLYEEQENSSNLNISIPENSIIYRQYFQYPLFIGILLFSIAYLIPIYQDRRKDA